MQTHFQNSRRRYVPVSAFAALVGALAVAVLLPGPVEAQGFGARAGAASGANGAIAGSRGVISNGQGSGAFGGGFVARDGQGNGAMARGGCAANPQAAGCSGRAATWGSDGTFSGVAGTEITGENGAVSSRRNLNRDADGSWSGASAVDASGAQGSYSGNATLDDGTYARGATYTGTEGQSATVEGSYQAGSGGSRSVTCTDASGATVSCP